MPWGGGVLYWLGVGRCSYDASTGLPPGRAENGGGVCKNPWRRARGKRFPARFSWLLWSEVYAAGRRGPRRREVPEAYGGGRAAPNPGQCRQRCRIRAWFESEGRHLVHLVADAQREVVKGAANDGVGAVIQRLERRYVAVLPHEHCRCAGEVVGQLRRQPWAAAVLCLVAECSAVLNVLENCSRKISGVSGESKNCPGKMSGVPNTS
jgi:hypothetical protein